jgi:hypothetical protein
MASYGEALVRRHRSGMSTMPATWQKTALDADGSRRRLHGLRAMKEEVSDTSWDMNAALGRISRRRKGLSKKRACGRRLHIELDCIYEKHFLWIIHKYAWIGESFHSAACNTPSKVFPRERSHCEPLTARCQPRNRPGLPRRHEFLTPRHFSNMQLSTNIFCDEQPQLLYRGMTR